MIRDTLIRNYHRGRETRNTENPGENGDYIIAADRIQGTEQRAGRVNRQNRVKNQKSFVNLAPFVIVRRESDGKSNYRSPSRHFGIVPHQTAVRPPHGPSATTGEGDEEVVARGGAEKPRTCRDVSYVGH